MGNIGPGMGGYLSSKEIMEIKVIRERLKCPKPIDIEEQVKYYLGSSSSSSSPSPIISTSSSSTTLNHQYLDSWSTVRGMNVHLPACIDGTSVEEDEGEWVWRKKASVTMDPKLLYTEESESWRHWDVRNLYTVLTSSIPFGNKLNKAVWRGATTGWPWPETLNETNSKHNVPYHSRAHLARLIPSLTSNPTLDVGVTLYTQEVPNLWGVSPRLSLLTQVSHKMLIIAPGNDVATGLKWALGSGSAVITPEHEVCSWLGEDGLVGGTHFIEVRRDWGDLEEKVQWCLENERECEEIGRMGRCWIIGFLDFPREGEVLRRVMEETIVRQTEHGYCPSPVAYP